MVVHSVIATRKLGLTERCRGCKIDIIGRKGFPFPTKTHYESRSESGGWSGDYFGIVWRSFGTLVWLGKRGRRDLLSVSGTVF